MNEEKVKYIDLPCGAKFRRAEKTEDGRTKILYESPSTLIPKPEPLIGGTDVYQKDNGTPYWYCRIKDGRDEFMHLYVKDLTENDLLYDANGKKRKFVTERQKKFKADVLKVLKNKPIEGYRWIPVFEPSKDAKGNLQYVTGEKVEVLRELDSYEWENLFNSYSPDNGSHVASIRTYFLLVLRWLKDGVATLEQLVDDSKNIGHYCNRDNAKHIFEKTGEREFGGLYGFVGNTYKIVKDSESSSDFSVVGGNYNDYGYEYPLANVQHNYNPYYAEKYGVGLLELTK